MKRTQVANRLPSSSVSAADSRPERRREVRTSGPFLASANFQRLARAARVTLLGGIDFIALVTAGLLACLLWAVPMRNQPLALYADLVPLVALFIFGYALADLYPGFGLGPVETLRRLSYVTAFGFLVLATFSFFMKLPDLYSRATFAIACAMSLVFVPLCRTAISGVAARWHWWSEPVVVIGTGERAAGAIRSIQQALRLGYRPAAVLSSSSDLDCSEVEGVPVVGSLDVAPALSARGIRIAFLALDESRGRAFADRLQQQFRHVVLLRQFDDLPVEGLQVRNLGAVVGIEYTNNLLVEGNRVIKRALDLAGATVALVLTAPLMLGAALLVKLFDPGPVFFFQNRAGLDGRRIAVPKIRTMRKNAESHLEDHLATDPKLREEWEAHYKLHDDPRLIPVIGRFFRRFSIDELPQLWTVLIGEMSLVGPRPFPDYHIQKFSREFRELRHRVRPGITGLWQVTVRSDGNIEEQQAYDSYYIRNWSVWLDLYLLSRTLATVASGRGAY